MKTKHKKRKLTAWISIILLLIFAVAHTTLVINPLIVRVSSAKINADVQHGINDMLYESILHDLSYKDIFVIERDQSNNITAMHYDTVSVGRTAYKAVQILQKQLAPSLQEISVPLGVFTGIAALSSVGQNVSIKIESVDAFTASVYSQFRSMAINQTLHNIYLVIKATVQLVVPFHKEAILLSHEFLLGESVIVGDVPQTFLMDLDQDKMLDLIPG